MARKRRRGIKKEEEEPEDVVPYLTPLTLRLAKHLSADRTSNVAFSPLSVYASLSLVAEGAGGRTRKEILKALGVRSCRKLAASVRKLLAESVLADQSQSGGPNIAFATGLWHDETWPLLPDFQAIAAASYKAEARAVDFRNKQEDAVGDINTWVAAATNNRIDSIVGPSSVGPDTSLVLASAIYIRGHWDLAFTKDQTTVQKFYRLDGSTVSTPFMRSRKSQMISVHHGYKVLKLQYRSPPARPPRKEDSLRNDMELGSSEPSRQEEEEDEEGEPSPKKTKKVIEPQYSMCIFLPDERGGLPEVIDRITSSSAFLGDILPDKRVLVGEFALPKFRLAFSDSIREVLRDGLGIEAAFNEEEADFSNMADDEGSDTPLFLGDVRHKAVIQVNEKGSMACEGTTFGMRFLAGAQAAGKVVDFVADHPFMFFVMEEVSGAIIFAGHVLDPST